MIGQLQCLVTMGRFDFHTQVTTMSRFRSASRKGQLERLQRVYGYVLKTKHYSSRYRTEATDYTYLPDMKHDWSYTVYSNIHEIIPMTVLNHFENQLLQLPPMMSISSTAWQLVHHLLHVCIFANKL